MNLYKTIEKQLKKEPNYITDSGELKKWVVITKAQNFDAELIGLLLDEKELKAKFFLEIKGVLVFNQTLFVQFLEQKNYLNDSYTSYKNKVGLNVYGKYLKQRNEVALVWPFKDCVLEGGQTEEADSRDEIFFNETLAQDEITQLLEPKVLTNAISFSSKAENSFKRFTRNKQGVITDDLIVKGNNLLALHSLKQEFAGKVKMIYIDPPYNTNNDSFTYNDSFSHSTWLTFIYNRISVAKQFLTDDGLIFISCDDNEQPYLKVVCDEIFNRENFIANLPTIMNLKGNNDEFGFAGTHEYTLVYALNKSKAVINEFDIEEDDLEKWDEDDIGYYKKGAPLRATGDEDKRDDRPEMFYPILVKDNIASTITKDEHIKIYNKTSKTFDDKYLAALIKKYQSLDFTIVLPMSGEEYGRWRWGFSEKNREKLSTDVIVSQAKNGISLYKKQRPDLNDLPSKKPKTLFYKPEYSSGNGTAQIKAIFGSKVFKNPKPVELIKDFIKIGSSENDIIMDFFAGSGTTGDAVIKLNNETGTRRQFILIEQLNYTESVTRKRVEIAIRKCENEGFIYFELKKYNQNFVERVKTAKDKNALLKIWEEMKEKSFLNYNVNLQKQQSHIEDFKALSLMEQKQHLVDLLDKNQLYVNLSSLNDKDFSVSDEDKKVTRDFYKIKK